MAQLTARSWQICVRREPARAVDGLAAESVLFESLPPATGRLLLWRSEAAVVIGKNQNPWRECHPQRIAGEGGCWVRRQTGGGAVYHDPGNLCYSVMVPRAGYCPDAVGQCIVDALRPLGIFLSVGPRHVLLAGDRKVSGTAFCHRRDRVLHHGTLLLEADLTRLRRWLEPAIAKVATRAVASVPAPVTNLRDLAPAVTVEGLIAALSAAFGEAQTIVPPTDLVSAEVARFCHPDWQLGLTPAFSVETADGKVEVRTGRICDAPSSRDHLIGQYFDPAQI